MLKFGRYCVCCLKELPPTLRMDAFFCPPPKNPTELQTWRATKRLLSPCWRLWSLKRLMVRRSSKSMKDLEKTISPHSKAAIWYRVQGLIDDKAWMFPATDRPTLRFDGIRRQTPGFLVHPFEPPVVPKRGTYAFTFYNAEGNLVDTPPGCYEFFLEPVTLVSVEGGTLLHDFHG